MTKTLIVMVAVMLMAGISQVSATTYTDLIATKDASVNLDAPTETAGTGNWIYNQNDQGSDYISFLMFDLSGINPSEVVVTSATLTVNQRVDHTVSTYLVLKEVASDTWDEATLCANNAPARGPVIGNVDMSNVGGSTATWLQNTIDVTSYVQASIGSGADYTVSFCYDLPGYSPASGVGNGSPYYRAIGPTREYTAESRKAGLLTVVVDVPEPATMLVLALGGLATLLRRRG